jgi:DNA-directed RNA polymerase subunit K/omega
MSLKKDTNTQNSMSKSSKDNKSSTDIAKKTTMIKEIENDPSADLGSKLNVLDNDAYDFYKKYDTTQNKMDPILNQYEKAAILGIRAQQLSEGAQPLIDIPEGIEDLIEIAKLELKAKKLPLIICREGREYWRACDLVDLDNE